MSDLSENIRRGLEGAKPLNSENEKRDVINLYTGEYEKALGGLFWSMDRYIEKVGAWGMLEEVNNNFFGGKHPIEWYGTEAKIGEIDTSPQYTSSGFPAEGGRLMGRGASVLLELPRTIALEGNFEGTIYSNKVRLFAGLTSLVKPVPNWHALSDGRSPLTLAQQKEAHLALVTKDSNRRYSDFSRDVTPKQIVLDAYGASFDYYEYNAAGGGSGSGFSGNRVSAQTPRYREHSMPRILDNIYAQHFEDGAKSVNRTMSHRLLSYKASEVPHTIHQTADKMYDF